MASDPDFVDFYELLQISPNAEPETIQRVYRMLASRFHPDNPETGNYDRFVLVNRAYDVLSDPEQRTAYDGLYQENHVQPIHIFETKDFSIGMDGEANRRMGILCLLYRRRRSDPEDPGLSILEFETLMSCAREHLMFTIWYLREQNCIRQDERSDYVITGAGVDYVEKNLSANRPLYKLLNPSPDAEAAARQSPRREGE